MILGFLSKTTDTICYYWAWWWEVSSKKDGFALAILTASTAIAVIFWLIWIFKRSRKGIASLPPGPRGLPIVGYLPFLGTNLHLKFTELAQSYGPIYKLWLGNKLCVVLSSPFLAKEVSRDQDTIFANRDPPIAALVLTYGGLDMAWSPNGSYWRTMRKVFVQQVLSKTSLDACYSLRRDEVQKTLRDLYAKIGTRVDIGQITYLTQFNVVMSMICGSTLGEKKANIAAEFRELASKTGELLGKPNISDFFPMLARFDFQGVEREMKRLLQWMERVLDTIIDESMKMDTAKHGTFKNEGKKDFIQILLQLKEEQKDSGTPINMRQIKALLMDIVVGGTDTTATTVEFAMAEMMQNPSVMKKAQEELTDVVGMKNIVEEPHTPKLLYLDAVVKETLRLHPALPLLVPRSPSQSCIVGGYTIPANTRVLLNVWEIHRDPQFWDNPSEFKPERFLNDSCKYDFSGNNFQYLPFGSGRRICPGLPLAERMVMYVLASLLHSFEWQLPKGEELDLTEKFGIVVKKRTPLIAIPTQRLSNLDLYAE